MQAPWVKGGGQSPILWGFSLCCPGGAEVVNSHNLPQPGALLLLPLPPALTFLSGPQHQDCHHLGNSKVSICPQQPGCAGQQPGLHMRSQNPIVQPSLLPPRVLSCRKLGSVKHLLLRARVVAQQVKLLSLTLASHIGVLSPECSTLNAAPC